MKRVTNLVLILLCLPLLGQRVRTPFTPNAASGPTYVNSGADFTGAGAYTTAWSPTNGNTLIVWVVTASNASVTLADGEGTGNSYSADCDITFSTLERGKLFRASNISGSGTYVLTVTGGTTPLIAAVEISGNRTADVTCSTLQQGAAGNLTLTGVTTVTANTILIDAVGSLTGATATLSETDSNFTIRQSCLTGASCFVGAIGTRVVSSTGTYSDGWTATNNSDSVAVLIAYK